MNVGSLFSGIGGIDLGLERAGMRVLWQVECDPYARAVLRKHWPDAALYDDVRSVGAANLAPVDLVCGGFPCQDISNAGKRVGIEGERSGLWSEYARIVREIRPRYVLVENVAALLARGLERVVGDLAACGYDAEWDCFPAAAFGAPHRRDRLFIVAYPNENGRGSRRLSVGTPQALAVFGDCGENLADASRHGRKQGRQTARAGLGLAGDGGDPLADAHVEGLEGRHGNELRERAGQRPTRTSGAFSDALREGWNGSRPVLAGAADRAGPFGQPARSDWWDAEPDVGGTLDGFSSWLDRSGWRMKAHKLYSAHADATSEGARQGVRAMRDSAHEAFVRWEAGGCECVPPQAVLFAYLRELPLDGDARHVAVASEEDARVEVRGLRADEEPARASCGREPGKQRKKQHPDSLRPLPQLLARGSEQAWIAYRRENAAAVRHWESGIARVASGVPKRVDRLRCLGNAVVPQVAEWIGRQILAHAEGG